MLHIDLPTRSEILKLLQTRGGPCVSIYLATTPLTEAAQKDRLALRSLAKEAVDQLEAAGVEKRSIWPIEAAVAELEGDDAWAHQALRPVLCWIVSIRPKSLPLRICMRNVRRRPPAP